MLGFLSWISSGMPAAPANPEQRVAGVERGLSQELRERTGETRDLREQVASTHQEIGQIQRERQEQQQAELEQARQRLAAERERSAPEIDPGGSHMSH
jgi:septal ring factor EnvC (AmiA/AmiB activator)